WRPPLETELYTIGVTNTVTVSACAPAVARIVVVPTLTPSTTPSPLTAAINGSPGCQTTVRPRRIWPVESRRVTRSGHVSPATTVPESGASCRLATSGGGGGPIGGGTNGPSHAASANPTATVMRLFIPDLTLNVISWRNGGGGYATTVRDGFAAVRSRMPQRRRRAGRLLRVTRPRTGVYRESGQTTTRGGVGPAAAL